MKEISFIYKNHRGETETRHVVFEGLRFIAHTDIGYGYQPGWFLIGFDRDRQAQRTFALSHIQLTEDIELLPKVFGFEFN